MADRIRMTSDIDIECNRKKNCPPISKPLRPRKSRPGPRSIVVQNRADAAVLGEQRIAAITEQVEVERLIGLLLAAAFDFDRDRLRRLAGGEGQRTGLGDIVAQ